MTASPLPQTIASLLSGQPLPRQIYVCGWLRSVRTSKNITFLAIADGSQQAVLQAVCLDGVINAETLAQLTTGTAVGISGTLELSPKAEQALELKVETLVILGHCAASSYPLQKKGHSLEFLRTINHLRPRSNTFGAVFRIRHALALATHQFFAEHQFTYVHTPLLTSNDCEGGGEMFEAVRPMTDGQPFFGRPAYLTVSGQLHGEAMAYGLGRIYTFGPTFRAENSNTARHLAEFWMIEPEMAFFTAKDNQQLAIMYLQAMVQHVLQSCENDLAFLTSFYDKKLNDTLTQIATTPFAQITYQDALTILQKEHPESQSLRWGDDLGTLQERFLVEVIYQTPVVVTDYPAQLKSFYMYQNDDNTTVAAMDILVPRIGEVIGGSQREHRVDKLAARMVSQGLDLDSYAWYLDINRFGGVAHAGFGLGFERLVMLCTGMTNIRDVIPFPRTPGSIVL